MKSIKSIILALVLPVLVTSFTPRPNNVVKSPMATRAGVASTSTALASKPFAIVVDAEIQPDRIDEFLDLIEKDAVGSRAEPGCLRFDVHQSQDNPNKFMFYEVYKDADAVAFHKEQPHFALWTNFKESGGVVSSVSYKLDGIFMSD
mmetsp:Transcript_8898/g.11147  ORF Transcript_8898/g.11147 Transcript_8898/m.11147 type:complete len:147 (+) Transcript_8898:137-577(+)